MSQEHPPTILPSQLRFTPYTTYYNSFFLLRTPVTVNGQLTEIGYSECSELTLNSRYPNLSVTFHSISSNLETILKKYGVSHVSCFWCEEVPLFQINFSSEYKLRKFLRSQQKVQSELATLFSAKFAEQAPTTSSGASTCDIPTTVQTQLFLVSPDAVKKDARVVAVTLENHSTCMTVWKESELFDFGALFRVYYLDPSKLPQQGDVTLRDLVSELDRVTDWFHMGIHMGVPDWELMAIRSDYQYTVNRKTHMLMKWMKLTSDLTWSAVVRALVGIKMISLAEKVALKYGVMVPSVINLQANALVDKVSSVDHQLASRIQKMTQEVEANDNELTRIESLLNQSMKEKTLVHSKHVRRTNNLTTVNNKTKQLLNKRGKVTQQLKLKKRELKYLQSLQKQQEENEDLRTIIATKETEIMQLQRSLDGLRQELESSKKEASSLREQLHQSTIELAEKSADVRQLERIRADLRTDLEGERRRVDQLLMQSAATVMGETVKEVKFQLASAKEQYDSQFRDTEMESHQQSITQKDEEIKRLSEKVQTLEAQLQGALQTHAREDEEEEKLHRLTVEVADLRMQLAEAQGDKLEAVRRLEGIQREKREMKQWIAELEKKALADPQKCTAVGFGVKIAETAQVAQFEVHLVDTDGDHCITTQDVTAELKSIASGSMIKAEVVSKTLATYEVSYQPGERGRHDLSVRVNGTPIQSSPFRVYVRQSPQLLDKPVRVIGGLKQPWRMVTTGNGEMIVCERNTLSMYTKNGTKIRTIEFAWSGTRSYKPHPKGVAIDGSGNMYITDWKSHSLFKLNSDRKLVKSVGGMSEEQGEFNCPDGIAISDNKVFVCDQFNHRIQMFDTDLNLFHCFGTKGSGEGALSFPADLAIDSAGDLYVADKNNDRIQVFSQRGKFLRTFGKFGSRPGELNLPCGIHVDHDWVYVADWTNNRVSVFTTSGEFITTIGNIGEGRKRGITIDEDGYVYVCDSYNHRIQVF